MNRIVINLPAGSEGTRFAPDADLHIDGSTRLVWEGRHIGYLTRQIGVVDDGRFARVEADIFPGAHL